jgi:hypothetical protein
MPKDHPHFLWRQRPGEGEVKKTATTTTIFAIAMDYTVFLLSSAREHARLDARRLGPDLSLTDMS